MLIMRWYWIVLLGSAVVFGVVGYFIKLSKDGKRMDTVKNEYLSHCPLTASESRDLGYYNNIK